MNVSTIFENNFTTTCCAVVLVVVLNVFFTKHVFGQGAGFGAQAVGGISVDTDGIVRSVNPQALASIAAQRKKILRENPPQTGRRCELQKVSLRRILEDVQQAVQENNLVSPEVLTLGGLEQIEYVFVDPDARDLILAGPSDKVAVDETGGFVGATSRQPLLLLEDLVVALRSIDAARMGGMRCSIDPTPEGIARLQELLSSVKQMANPQRTFRSMEEALGPQRVTVGGVPADTHFAQVLVAADYRMKRIGMGLESSEVAELPSYLSMVQATTASSTMLPRFWLEAQYSPIARDPDELGWKLTGGKMVCMTETDLLVREGMKRGSGRADKNAARWCEQMTACYDDLALSKPVFRELKNCVDLAVVAALIDSRQLADRAGLDLSLFKDASSVQLSSYAVPKQVPTVAHGIKRGSRWILSASGGVQFQPWAFLEEVVEAQDVASTRKLALASRPEAGICWE
jgi:hypothetical protein